jgi:DNA modification methylase
LSIELLHGDCLIESDLIESGSVDLILTDLPYGTMNGFNGIDWDFAIAPKKVYEIANRILRKNGKMVLFSQEPYTGQLTTQAIPNVPFNYRMIWQKDSFANALLCNKAPVSYFEDILVFSKRHETEINHPIRQWLKSMLENSKVAWSDERIIDIYLKHGIASSKESAKTIAKHKLDWTYKQLEPINKKHYMALSSIIKFDRDYNEIEKMYKEYNSKYPATFNLWEGNKYKSNILKYRKDYDGYHPTQKPILLLEDLIKTFSNEGDLVVDLTMGSGSTGVACVNTNRNFIGIELDDKYFEIAKQRISDAQNKLKQIKLG